MGEMDVIVLDECELSEEEGTRDRRLLWQPYNCVHNSRRKRQHLCSFRARGECRTKIFLPHRCKQAEAAAEWGKRTRAMIREIEQWRPGRLEQRVVKKWAQPRLNLTTF